jgi:NDP-sugar pyrophosphorylase family protein
VRIHPQDLPFIDVGTPDDYVAACRTLAAPDAAFIERGTRLVERGTADVQASIVWDDVTIGNDVRLVRTVVTDGVDVPDGSSWEDVILRRANTPAEPGEQQIGDLLVTPLRPL